MLLDTSYICIRERRPKESFQLIGYQYIALLCYSAIIGASVYCHMSYRPTRVRAHARSLYSEQEMCRLGGVGRYARKLLNSPVPQFLASKNGALQDAPSV